MSPTTNRDEWISRNPAELSTGELLEDLLGYEDGFAGRPLRHGVETAPIVAKWIRTPRGRELALRLHLGQAGAWGRLDPDPRRVDEDPEPRLPAHPHHQPQPDGAPGPAIVLVIVGIPLLACIAVAVWALAGFPGLSW